MTARGDSPRTPKRINLRADALDRFVTKFERQADGCWLWAENTRARGYGYFCQDKEKYLAHRVSYELFVGPIPDGLFIDHLCRVRHCVNPEHLEPVTNAENISRAPWTAIQLQSEKSHCPRGHAYDEANTYRHSGERHCRACRREAARKSRARRHIPNGSPLVTVTITRIEETP